MNILLVDLLKNDTTWCKYIHVRFMYKAIVISLKRWCHNWIQMLMMLNCLWHTFIQRLQKIRVRGPNFTLANTHRTPFLQPIIDLWVYTCTIMPFQTMFPISPMGKGGCHNDNFTLSITKCVIVKFKILLNFLSDIFDQYYFIQYNWHGHAKKMVYRYWKPWPNDLSDLLNYKQYLKNPAEAITHRSKCH